MKTIKQQDFGVFNPDFPFHAFLAKWCGLKGEFYTNEYKLFWGWYAKHGMDYDAEDTLPEGLDPSLLRWDGEVCGWGYEFPDGLGITEEGSEAWDKARDIVEDLARVGVISGEQAQRTMENFCDIALEG